MVTRILLGILGAAVLVLALSLAIPADSAPVSAPAMQAVTPRPTLEPPPKPTAEPTALPSSPASAGAELALRVNFATGTLPATIAIPSGETAGNSLVEASTPHYLEHTVQAGENLYRIGLAYNVSWIELARLNQLANADLIYVGQVLSIPENQSGALVAPTAHLEQAGENLYLYGVAWQSLWTVVEWQGPDGHWHEVDGWRGSLDTVEIDRETGAVTGWRYWWVGKHELGRGPFRWLVYDAAGGAPLVVSESFDLPDAFGHRVIVDVMLTPQ